VSDEKIIYKDEGYKIYGACMEVYKTLGNGFLETVYQEALELEFRTMNIEFMSQPMLEIKYKDVILKHEYKPDFICYNKIIVEIKAVSKLTDEHRAQLHNYLKATGFKLGILINFGHFPLIEKERIIR
jgi:GxxExxY protein